MDKDVTLLMCVRIPTESEVDMTKCPPNRQVTILHTGTTVGGESRATSVEVYCPSCNESFYTHGFDEGFTKEDIDDLAANESGPCHH